ncbi:MAG TPA: cell wall-binding repeat-containing protein [Acidimicrobiales bacterium]|nr:cell wall-binding repeat-containing protein [Acidimicrobiales bacterium]
MTGVVAGVTSLTGLSALAVSAHATSSFTFTRVEGATRYGTAANIATRAFNPNGTGTIGTAIVANGLPGHQADALAASFLAGNLSAPILLVDGSSSIPQETLAAISSNKITNCVVVGGTSAVSSAEVSALNSAGCNVSKTYAGATRYDTMQQIDTATGTTVGTAGGQKTCILASGDDAHLVDALGAGAVAYEGKFPVILTNATSSTLQPQASQTISSDGCQKLVVVGGSAAIPTSQYSPAPSGTTTDTTATGGQDRSQTSMLLADDAIKNYGLTNPPTGMGVATGATYVGSTTTLQNDGADALAASVLDGINKYATLITLNPTTAASVDNFAAEHASSLDPGLAYGGNRALAESTLSDIAHNAGGSFGTGSVSVNQSSVQQGGAISGVVENPSGVQSLTVSGCGLSNQSVTFDSNGNFTVTIPSNQPTGNCNLTFTATPTGGGSPVTTTVPENVTSTTTNTAGCNQTSLPQLCSASIVSTTPSPGTTANPQGTVVQYVFNQNVSNAVLSPQGFKVWSSNATSTAGTSTCGTGGNQNCATAVNGNTNAINVLFPTINTSAQAGALTLATVAGPQSAGGPAVITGNGQSPDGAAAIGNSATGNLTAGQTNAPDPEQITATRLGPSTFNGGNSVAIDLMFDQTAYAQAAATIGGISGSSGFSILYTSTPPSGAQPCVGPAPGSNGSSGGVNPGGEGTQTFTIVCPEQNNGTVPSTATIARIIVQQNTVGSQPVANGIACGTTNGAGTTNYCNPLEVTDTPHNASAYPDLTNVQIFSGSGPGGVDQMVYSFDQPISTTTLNAADFYYYTSGATQVQCTAGNGCQTSGANNVQVSSSNPSQVIVTWGVGTLKSAVGGEVAAGGVTGANSNLQNQDDEFGATNPNQSTLTSGTVQAPQLQSVKRNTINGPNGTSYSFTYTYSQPIAGTTTSTSVAYNTPQDLHVYDADGVELTCNAATIGFGTAANQITCTSYFQQANGNTAATNTQLTGATLGTSDAGAVTGANSPNNHASPEGDAAVS